MPWRGPQYEGEVPSLGYDILDWITEYLVVPDGPAAGEPLELTEEQAQFVLNFYRVDPKFRGPAVAGRSMRNARLTNRAILCRPKGWGKSPLLGALAIVESVGDVILDGWDADGEPVARPWTSFGFKAKVQVLATSEDQTENTWDPLLDMIMGSGSLVDDYQLDPKETFVSGPRLKLEYATSAGDSREGGRPVFAVFDQTEAWRRSNGGVKLANAVRRNLTKTQGSSIESPNAYTPGDGSVSESSFKAAELQKARAKRTPSYRPTILLDHRGAPEATDIYDEKSLMKGLGIAYGDSADVNGGWVNLERVFEDFWDPDSTVEESRQFFLNQITAAADSWLSQLEVDAVNVPHAELDVPPIAAGQMITMGFDGSRGRKKGVTDSTALIGCRVSDGHLFELGVWEQPKDWPKNTVWEPPVAEVVATVAKAFKTYKVAGFYGDPSKWESYFAKWEARYGTDDLIKAKASAAHPFTWWMAGQRSSRSIAAFKTFKDAVLGKALTFDGSIAIRRHLLNARMVVRAGGIWIEKKHPDSEDKIDVAIAAVLAYQARLDAIAAGALKPPRRTRRAPIRKLR
jgi:hypothetical protein